MKDQLVRAISRDGTVNAVAVTTRYLTEEEMMADEEEED